MKWSSSEIRFNTNAGRQQGGCSGAQQHALAALPAALLQLSLAALVPLAAQAHDGSTPGKCGCMQFEADLCRCDPVDRCWCCC